MHALVRARRRGLREQAVYERLEALAVGVTRRECPPLGGDGGEAGQSRGLEVAERGALDEMFAVGLTA